MASSRIPSSRINRFTRNPNPLSLNPRSGVVSMSFKKRTTISMCTTAISYMSPYVKPDTIYHEKIEEMIYNSVSDIVKNLREAPLLVHVYNNGESKTEKAESWLKIKNKWAHGEDQVPEGIIFVEELNEEEERGEGEKAWGVVVQGKGGEGCGGGPACYLLKTSRVRAGSGLGLFCTHFCLVKVKSFRETAMSQLTNCWL